MKIHWGWRMKRLPPEPKSSFNTGNVLVSNGIDRFPDDPPVWTWPRILAIIVLGALAAFGGSRWWL